MVNLKGRLRVLYIKQHTEELLKSIREMYGKINLKLWDKSGSNVSDEMHRREKQVMAVDLLGYYSNNIDIRA